MKQFYVFTAGEASARAHLDNSIKTMVHASLLDRHLDPEQSGYVKSLLPDTEGFYAWGAVPGIRNIPMWEDMQEGDVVLTVFENRYHYLSTVITKIHNFGLAKEIWGVDAAGKTWEYIYLLTRPKTVNVHVNSEPVSTYLNNGYRGFTKVSDERVTRIKNIYGSLEDFTAKVFSTNLPPTVVERQLKDVEDEYGNFDPKNLVDGRKKILTEIVRRRGQPKFRKALLDAYEGACAVTGCDVEAVLEAAHITAYFGDHTNHVTNGLLLRADIHTLFDLGELKIDDAGIIHISEKLENSIYSYLKGQRIRPAKGERMAPNREALVMKFIQAI